MDAEIGTVPHVHPQPDMLYACASDLVNHVLCGHKIIRIKEAVSFFSLAPEPECRALKPK
jgi:hypothetical protein